MNAEIFAALAQLEKERGIPQSYMIEKITQALVAAYKKDKDGYTDNGTEVISESGRSLRLRPDGSVTYQSGGDGTLSIEAAGDVPTLKEAVAGVGTLLNSLLAPYEEEYKNDGNVTVGFNKTVLLEDGIYFNDSFEGDNSIEDMISGVRQQEKTYTVQTGDTLWSIAQKNDLTFRELCALNPNFKGTALTESSNIQEGDTLIVTKEEATLEVRITKIETRQEKIPFTTETTQSNEYTKDTTKTLQEGENGLRLVTLQNVYDTNGTLLEQTVVSTQTLKEAVPKKVVVGTKKITNKTAYITGSGQFIWPVPNYRYCSRWYGGRHRGVDSQARQCVECLPQESGVKPGESGRDSLPSV